MATSRGLNETEKLKQNLDDQLDRLMQQLIDLDECKDDLDEEEYNETKAETIEQLKEFRETLLKMNDNLSLVDSLSSMQIAIQAAVSDAFKTPEVIKMFAKRQPGDLRNKLTQVERDMKIGKMNTDEGIRTKLEILTALKKLKDELLPSEEEFLMSHSDKSLRQFETANDDSSIDGSKVSAMARK